MTRDALNRRTPEFVDEVRRMKASGLSVNAIKNKLRCGVSTVYKALEQGPATAPRYIITDEQRVAAHAMRAGGATHAVISAEIGIPMGSVRHVLDEAPPVVSSKRKARAATYIPARMMVRLTEYQQRMRDSFKARGMGHEEATREAMRVCAASAVEVRGDSNSRAGGGGVGVSASFHAQSMEEATR